MLFVDTTAFLAMLSTGDLNHQRAYLSWSSLLEKGQIMLTDNYVIADKYS